MTRTINPQHGMGWRPQLPDHRDRIFDPGSVRGRVTGDDPQLVARGVVLPAKADLWPNVPPVWDQGQLGTCVTHGSIRSLLTEGIKQGLSIPMLSRLFVYAKGRDLEGTSLTTDGGMEVRDGIKVLATLGAPAEELWPYSDITPGPWQQEPPASLDASALANMAVSYESVVVGSPGAPMRTAIAAGFAIAFGFRVPSFFESGVTAAGVTYNPATDVLPLPGPQDAFIGGHCVCITGYDFTCRGPHLVPYFVCDNSWGRTWGGAWGGANSTGGRFAIDARYFSGGANSLASDLWIVRVAK